MGFRDDRDALLARLDALERDLERTQRELKRSTSDRAALQQERDELRVKLAKYTEVEERQERKKRRQEQRKTAEAQQRATARNAWFQQRLPYIIGGAALVPLLVIGGIRCRNRAIQPPSIYEKADYVRATCPLVAGKPLIVIDEIRKRRRVGHRSYYFYSTYDPDSGKRLVRARIASRTNESAPTCYGYERDLVWMKTRSLGFHARKIDTGEVAISEAQIAAKLSAAIDRIGFEAKRSSVVIVTKDGRSHRLVTQPALQVHTMDPNSRVQYASNASFASKLRRPWGELVNNEALRMDGRGPRRYLTHGGRRVGDRDWLDPNLLVNGQYGTIAWSNPDSVIIVEPLELGSRLTRLTRLGLNGKIHWQYTPGRRSVAKGNSIWWLSTPSGKTILYFDKAPHLVGIDAATGKEKFKIRL